MSRIAGIAIALGVARLFPEHGFGLWLRLGAATLALLLGTFSLPGAMAGEVIDRIVATVNGRIILQSDLDEALAYEALLDGRNLGQFAEPATNCELPE